MKQARERKTIDDLWDIIILDYFAEMYADDAPECSKQDRATLLWIIEQAKLAGRPEKSYASLEYELGGGTHGSPLLLLGLIRAEILPKLNHRISPITT